MRPEESPQAQGSWREGELGRPQEPGGKLVTGARVARDPQGKGSRVCAEPAPAENGGHGAAGRGTDRTHVDRKAWTMDLRRQRNLGDTPNSGLCPSHPPGEPWIFFNEIIWTKFSETETSQETSPGFSEYRI